ncbi:MAG: FkbM family methyltransferase [Armatimonadia bacterium]
MGSLIITAGPVDVALLPGCRVAARAAQGEAFEPESLAAWAQMVRPGLAALDVGAYTGLYAIAAVKLGAKAYAFEPMRAQCDRLEENAELNGVKIEIRRVAVSDFAGAAEFRFNARVPLTSGGSLVGKGPNSQTVITRRLDELDLPPVAAIKIDVERAEDKVLRGARQLIAAHRPQILAEVLDLNGMSVLERLLPRYRVQRLLDGRNAWMVPL